MREIKFRAWDTFHKQMIFGVGVNYGNYVIDFLGRVFNFEAGAIVENRFILRQYTGLKDKNGKEIYEGDICHAYKANSYLKGNYEVVWDTKRGRWAYKGNTYQVGSSGNLDCEVIGNVFENPGLLK